MKYGTNTKIRIEKIRAKTPPSLLGIGLGLHMQIGSIIWLHVGGVLRGFAGV